MERNDWRRGERGLTLLEVLVALLILSMVASILYSFLLMAVSVYKRVTVETTMRNQGDALFSRIMSELSNAIYVEQLDPNTRTGIRYVKPSADAKQYIELYEMRLENGKITVQPIMSASAPKTFELAPPLTISGGRLVADGHHRVIVEIDYERATSGPTREAEHPRLHIRSQIPIVRAE